MNPFTSIPFFRILIPFVAGILMALALDCPPVSFWYCTALLALLAGAFVIRAPKTLWLLIADAFLLVYGATLISTVDIRHDERFYGSILKEESLQHIVAVIHDVPVEKEKHIKCELKLLALRSGKEYKTVTGTVIAYFKRPVNNDLKAGSVVLVTGKLLEVPPPLNPFEFDYKSYLQRKQIFHTMFVDAGSYALLPADHALNPVWQAGLVCKRLVMQRLHEGGLSAQAYAICCALLTGYDDEIDRPVMEAFSHSGTLHVLSVSGLHTGLIYLVLGFLFDLADRQRKFRLLRFISIAVVLWLFALLTGFSAPVLRAVIMFNLFGIGNLYFRNDTRNQLNILLVSAFILLSYNPFFITDVGFLLSYFALAGLICFQPGISALWRPSDRIMDYVWQSVSASAAATLSTLPLTLFYFRQFPVWFLVCNLVVVPATFVLLLLAVLVVARFTIVSVVINKLTAWIIAFIQLFNFNGIGFIDGIHFNASDALFLSLLIVMSASALQYRTFRLAAGCFIMVILWQMGSLLGSYQAKQDNLLAVYQLRHKSTLTVKNKTTARFSSVDSIQHRFHIQPHVISFNYADTLVRPFNYVASGQLAVLVLNTPNHWPQADLSAITILVLANNFKITAADLQPFKSLKTIVADGSNNNYRISKAEELSRKFGVDFYTTTRKGAYLLTL